MTREQKYPDTTTFRYYNANTHNHKSGDCVIRAICTALGQSWEQTLRELTDLGLKYGYVPTDTSCYSKYLEKKGWAKCSQPRKSYNNLKYTGDEWCKRLQSLYQDESVPNMIAHIGGQHIVAIIDGKVNDIWNSTGSCIGNYWMKIQ